MSTPIKTCRLSPPDTPRMFSSRVREPATWLNRSSVIRASTRTSSMYLFSDRYYGWQPQARWVKQRLLHCEHGEEGIDGMCIRVGCTRKVTWQSRAVVECPLWVELCSEVGVGSNSSGKCSSDRTQQVRLWERGVGWIIQEGSLAASIGTPCRWWCWYMLVSTQYHFVISVWYFAIFRHQKTLSSYYIQFNFC